MNKVFILLFFFGLFTFSIKAQEILCDVTINTPKLQTADPKIFKNLKIALQEFVNNRKWSDEKYENEEKIELNIIITINKELSQTSFEAQLTIQASRPVYNSAYNSVLIQHLDKEFFFTYGEFEVLDFTEGTFSSNLTSTIAYYVYVVLGMDYDSFAELGGDKYLNKAQDILNAVPRGAARGWLMQDGDRNRFWLIENLLNVRMQGLRRAMYQYHLLGLDRLSNEESRMEGLSNIEKALTAIRDANAAYPASMIVQTFVNTKRDEIINIFMVADLRTRRRIYDIMIKLDGTFAASYQKLTAP
jgi:hypothetical protein